MDMMVTDAARSDPVRSLAMIAKVAVNRRARVYIVGLLQQEEARTAGEKARGHNALFYRMWRTWLLSPRIFHSGGRSALDLIFMGRKDPSI
jgi:hypothetical protein